MFQQITIVGNLGRDPEMRYTPGAKAVTSFSVAVSRKTKDGDKTVWFRVSAWEKQAELCNDYLKKGSKVLVIGELEEPRIWTNKAGEPQASLEVTARDVRFLTPKPEGDEQPAKQDSYKLTEVEEIPF